jgi:CDP-glucose 4,6-dehydratase
MSDPTIDKLRSTFKGRKVFVTGHTGFKGSWLCLWLKRLGASVTGYSLPAGTQPNNFEASHVKELLTKHHEADICDREGLQKALQEAQPDFVFHLAAQPLVRLSFEIPYQTWKTNVLGTAALLDAVRTLKTPVVVVVVTSDKCYENDEQGYAFRETDPLGGFDPYSASKAAAELVVASYRRSFFNSMNYEKHLVKLASARAGNVIGGGDWAQDRIVTEVVRALATHEPVQLRNPRAVCPWQHVVEPLSGYLLLAAKMFESHHPDAFCDAWNFGPAQGAELCVGDFVDGLCKAWGGGSWKDTTDPRQPHDASYLRLSIEKALWNLDWRPRWDIQTTIARTAAWYKLFTSDRPASMRAACERDIQAYEESGAQPRA